MVDHTTSKASTSGFGFFVAAAIVVLVLLYAVFAGNGVDTAQDPAAIAPVADDTVPTTQ